MDMQDKILSAVLDTQRDVKDLGERMGRVETVQEKVHDNRHEAEISAVRSDKTA